jgi:uncharacterized protein
MATGDEKDLAPFYKLFINGNELPAELSAEITEVGVSTAIDAAGTFWFQLGNWDMEQQRPLLVDDDLFKPGGTVKVQLGFVGAMETVMEGEITGLEAIHEEQARGLLRVMGYDKFHRLRRGAVAKTYLQVKDSDVAAQIAGDLGLSADAEATSTVHPYLVQIGQTPIDFLLTRARAIGYSVDVSGSKLIFKPLPYTKPKSVTVDWETGLVTFRGYLSTANQVSDVQVRGWDPKEKRAIVGKASASDIKSAMGGQEKGPEAAGALGGGTLTIVDRPVSSEDEANAVAKAELERLALEYITGEATIHGDPKLRAGDVIEIKQVGKRFTGLYFITECTHLFDGAYTTRLKIRRAGS